MNVEQKTKNVYLRLLYCVRNDKQLTTDNQQQTTNKNYLHLSAPACGRQVSGYKQKIPKEIFFRNSFIIKKSITYPTLQKLNSYS